MGAVMGKIALDAELSGIFASNPAAMAEPYAVWNSLRETAAVYEHGSVLLVSRHEDVSLVIGDSRFLTNTFGRGNRYEAVRANLRGGELAAFDQVTAFEAMYISRTDGETHARLRRIGQRAFTPARIAAMRGRIARLTDALFAPIATAGGGDAKLLAWQLPLTVVAELFGVPPEDLPRVHRWSAALFRNRGGTETPALMEAHAALGEFRAWTEALIERSRQLRDDERLEVVRAMLDAEQEERLSPDELTAMILLVLSAGHETTTNLIATGLKALLESGQWRDLAADPLLAPRAVEEALRYVAPVQWTGRVAGEDVEVGGTAIPRGAAIFALIAAANRDPAVFADPDRFDIHRTDSRKHLGFGYGPHFCIGFQLARLEGAVVFETLARKYPSLALAGDAYSWTGNAMLRTLVSLPVAIR